MEKPLSNRETVGAGPPPPGPRGFPEPGSQPMRAPLDPERAGCGGFLIENSAPLPHRFVPQFAALDLGTNNCRLLIARPMGAGFRVVDAFSRIVRLGEGLAATGALSEEAMAAYPRGAARLRREDCRAQGRRRRAMSPPKRAAAPPIARTSSPECRRRSGSRSRSSRASRRRDSSSPVADRCSIRASPMRSSSTSAAARRKSSGCGCRARPTDAGGLDSRFDLAAVRGGHPDRSVRRHRGVAGDLPRDGRRGDGGARAVRARAIASGAMSVPAACRCSAARAR